MSVAHWRAPWLPGLPSSSFQQRISGQRKTQRKGELDWRVQNVLLKRVNDLMFHFVLSGVALVISGGRIVQVQERSRYLERIMLRQVAEFIAVLSCALFAGAAVYINLVEHPARMQCGVELATTEFAPSYRRATVMQASCAAIGLLSSVAAWLAGATVWWLIAWALLGSVIPFTLIAILPTNKRLLSPTLDRRSEEAERLLTRWNALHAVRSVLSGLALVFFLCLAIFGKAI